MKLAVVSSAPVPRVYGGMDRLLEGLAAALREHHPTDLVTLPVDERSAEGVLKGYYDFYNLDLSAYDAVITCKAPAYMVRHPRQVLYLSHRLRVFYDLYEARDAHHARLRRLIQWMDNWAMAEERIPRIFTIGETVSRRLIKWGGIASTAIHPPTTFTPLDAELFKSAESMPAPQHFFAPGRLHAWKRTDLIIRAMKRCKADVPLILAGLGPDEAALRDLAAGDPRIRFVGHVSEAQLRELYAGAVATIFTPINEDLGYITFESFLSGRPVLTASDAGEPALIVRDGVSGFIRPPTPEALAERLDWMATHRTECDELGAAGRESMREVTWERVTNALLRALNEGGAKKSRASASPAHNGATETTTTENKSSSFSPPASSSFHTAPSSSSDSRIHLLVTDNQMIDPPVGGGRIRIWELYRHLPSDFVTTYLGTHDHPGPAFRDQWMAPNFREIVMPLTMLHFRSHEIWRRLTGGDATIDVTMPLLLGRCSPRYQRLLAKHLVDADILICAHPWMFPWLPAERAMPTVYDSQNCEAAVKGALLERTLAGRHLARRVEATERLAVTKSDLTLACSPDDARQFVQRYEVPRERIFEAPNGVDCERIHPASAAEKAAARIRLALPLGPLAIFIGSAYAPNQDAVESLVQHIAAHAPEWMIAIGGGAGPAWQKASGSAPPPNVRLLGMLEAEDLLRLYQAADVGLNPMRQGSGTNIKMLDYMAAGLPIITTSVGARGISGEPGKHYRVATRDAFAAALRELQTNDELRRRMGADARALAEREYDWRGIAGRLAEVLRHLAARTPRPASVAS